MAKTADRRSARGEAIASTAPIVTNINAELWDLQRYAERLAAI
jgi:hypothetical protein